MENLRRRAPSMTADECRISADWDLPLPIRLALAAGALCNDAVLKPDPGPGCFHAIGDPTEACAAGGRGPQRDVPGPPAGRSAARGRSAV